MIITLELPDDVFCVPQPSAQIAREVRQAAAIFWSARGELLPEGQAKLLEGADRAEVDVKERLLQIPDVGEDADFARISDHGRPDEPWHS